MDTNNINLKFKTHMINADVLEELLGFITGDGIPVLTDKGIKTVSRNNHIDVNIRYINKLQLLNNNTISVIISYPKFFKDNNSYCITNQKDLDTVQSAVIRCIENIFKTKVDKSSSFHSRIDYPINIILDDKFEDWNNVLVLISKAVNNKHRNTKLYYGVSDSNKLVNDGLLTFINGDMDINFYNQRQNIFDKKGKDIGVETLRVELRFKRRYIIDKHFSSSSIKDVKLNDINNVAKTILTDVVFNNIISQLQKEKAYLKDEFIKFLDLTKSNKISEFVKEHQTNIFDVELIYALINELDISRQCKDKYRKQARESLTSVQEKSSIKFNFFNNFDRLNLLMTKTLGKKINFKKCI